MERIIPKRESIDNQIFNNDTIFFDHLRYYLRARLLYPKNGKSCKQLAILAVMTVSKKN